MSQEFFSFDEALERLEMSEAELKRLVSEGEIRAFRDKDRMKFKADDIQRFRSIQGEDTIEDDEIPEELVFDEDDADQEVGMATAAISDDSFLEEDDAPLELEEEDATELASSSARPSRSAGGAYRAKRVIVDEPEEKEHPAWSVVMALGSVILFLGLLVALDAVQAQSTGVTEGIKDFFKDNFLS